MCNSCVIENVKQNMLSRRLLFKGAVAGVTAMAAGSLAAPVLAQSPRQVVDLTHTYDSTFPTFDGKPGIEMEWAADIAKSGYQLHKLTIFEHTGTHIDAPFHFSADGASVAGWMVEHGQALDWPRYSHGAYAAQQARAEAAKVGLWVGMFQAPWDWRAGHTDGAAPSSQPLGIISRRQVAQSYSCQPRRTCSQIESCEEANWYLQNCSWGGKLDRDKDGIPCESLC